jgi:hypothetical protein
MESKNITDFKICPGLSRLHDDNTGRVYDFFSMAPNQHRKEGNPEGSMIHTIHLVGWTRLLPPLTRSQYEIPVCTALFFTPAGVTKASSRTIRYSSSLY